MKTTVKEPASQDAVRARIIAAGEKILAKDGREGLTTRAVAVLAGVQAPTLYRLFGDKGGLLEAVAEHAMRKYVQSKGAQKALRDPLEDLRAGWDLNIAFSLAHPAVFSIISGRARPGHKSQASEAGQQILEARIQRLAKAGRLRVGVGQAVNLMRAMGLGTIHTLLGMPPAKRDLSLAVAARESVIAAITTASPAVEKSGSKSAAIALRASLEQTQALTPGERLMLDELLERLSS